MGRDSDDYIQWINGTYEEHYVGGFAESRLSGSGLAIANGLYVGDVGGTPTDNDIHAEGTVSSGVDMDTPRGYFTENFQTPSSDKHLVARHAQNAVVASGQITALGGVGGHTWNIATISKIGTGIYDITLDRAVDPTACAINITPVTGASPGNGTHIATAKFTTSLLIRVYVYILLAAGPILSYADSAFALTITGRPLTLP